MVTRKTAYWWKLSWILLLNVLHTNVEAGLTKRSGRMAREVYPEIEPESDANQAQVCVVGDVVYTIDELVPADQPCLKCRCQPPGVQCETIKCVKKSGCKAIHRPNKCCPDYQCECHHEGRTYANGERLKTPSGGECKVCYCRGGEVQCAEVSCYIRTDCEGKTVPGQCCPKYDHCPPKEPLSARPTTDSSSPNSSQWPKLLHNSTEETTTPNPTELEANKIETEGATVENTIKMTKATQTDFTDDNVKQIEQPKITIHEIIPEIKEIPITSPTNQNQHPLVMDESKEVSNDNDLLITDSEPDSSEISEVFQQPPPVLRIGDKLLFLKQGELVSEKDASTPSSIITIIGAEGLQRGFEESGEFHEVVTKTYDDSAHSLFTNSNNLEPKTSESTHILSLVKHKKNPISSTTTESTTTEETVTTLEPILENSNKSELSDTVNGTNYDTVVGDNPAYPAIPEIMSSNLEISNISDTSELTTVEAETNTTMESVETTVDSSEYERSTESIEESREDSGEYTTAKDDHDAIQSDEDASVEPSETNSESIDMLKDATSTKTTLDDVEMIQNKTEQDTIVKKDVEMINFTHPDIDIKSEKLQLPVKSIGKRENSRQDEADEVFKELEAELNVDNTERTQTVEEEKNESDKIFQELLEETSTPASIKSGDKNAETIQKFSDAIAQLTLRERKNSFDSNILGFISNLFSSQYKYERRK